METREFVIPVRRRWTLWILPTIAIVYFLAVLLLIVLGERVRGVNTDLLVLGGVALFAVVFLVQIPFFFTRRPKNAAPEEPSAPPAYAPAAASPEPLAAPAPVAMDRDDELLVTAEAQKGLRVLEYSRPAKSQNKGAVYAKTYVPVTKEFVLRVETLAADRAEI